jgi:hypothetical protein
MDFQEQARLHGAMRDELYAAIDEERPIDATRFKADRHCTIGCWLHGEGRTHWAGNHAFLGLFEAHKAFHALAGAVAERINSRELSEAQRMLRTGTPFALALADLNAAFRRMRAAADNHAA